MEVRSPARVRNELTAAVCDVLQGSATVRQTGGRDTWLAMLSGELAAAVEPLLGDALRPWLLKVVETCASVRDGLPCLARSLGYLEGDSTEVRALWRLVDEWEAVDYFDGADLHPLRPLLRTVGPSGLAGLARRASRSRIQEFPARCDTAWQVFLHLAGSNAAQDELPAALAFLDLVADRIAEEGRSADAEELRAWTRRQARAFELETHLLDWQRARVNPPPPSVVPAYLMIQFEPDGIDPERYHLSHWRQSDTAGWHPLPGETQHLHRTELPHAVERLIENAEEGWADLRSPVILEFILPMELLNEPVEWWHKESDSASPTPLVMDYTVLLRSLERLRRTAWHRPWQRKWRQLADAPGDSRSHWSRPDGDRYLFHLERELKEDEAAVCLVLSQPPDGPDGVGRQEVLAGLRAGVPAMIWHRGDCADAGFRDAVNAIVDDRGLGRLAERVALLRKDALALGPDEWDDHVGRHVAILYDDPQRKPGSATPQHG